MKNSSLSKIIAFACSAIIFIGCTKEEGPVVEPEPEMLVSQDINENASQSEDDPEPQTHVPDDAFEQYLIDKGYDDVLDDYVLTANIKDVEEVDLYTYFDVADLTGLEDFEALTTLILEDNAIPSFDASQYSKLTTLSLRDLPLTELVIENTCLEFFGFSLLSLEKLFISKNHSLKDVSGEDSGIEFFKLHENPVLEDVTGLIDVGFGTLSIQKNESLKSYFCNSCSYKTQIFTENANLEVIGQDFDDGLNLEYLTITNNPKITSHNISDFKILKSFNIENSAFTSIDVSQNTELTSLDVTNNPLTCIKVNQDQLDNIPSDWFKDPEDCYALNCP